jgi:hypothetical protein
LVRCPVLAYADRIVRKDIDDREFHQGCEPNGGFM